MSTLENRIHRDAVHDKQLKDGRLVESPRRLPIRHDVDVLVCGGGPAGVGAALAAAREGASVMIVERAAGSSTNWCSDCATPGRCGRG